MQKLKSGFLLLLLLTLAVSVSFTGCSKKAAQKSLNSVIVLTIGKAEVISAAQTIPAAVGVKVQKGDTITCGAGGYVTLQIGDVGIVKILENSQLKVVDLFSEQKGEIYLSGGQILSKISKMKKGDSFNIKTPTTVASVRGTEFSTSYSYATGRATVSVKEGKVAVLVKNISEKTDGPETVPKDKAYTEKALVDAGKTAEVAPSAKPDDKAAPVPAVVVRAISKGESLTIEKVSIVPIIENVDKKTVEEINTVTKPVIEKEKKIDADLSVKTKEEKKQKLIEKKSATIEEIKEAFERIDEITLYSGRVVRGAIITRGKVHTVLTSNGTVSIKESDIKSVKVLR